MSKIFSHTPLFGSIIQIQAEVSSTSVYLLQALNLQGFYAFAGASVNNVVDLRTNGLDLIIPVLQLLFCVKEDQLLHLINRALHLGHIKGLPCLFPSRSALQQKR